MNPYQNTKTNQNKEPFPSNQVTKQGPRPNYHAHKTTIGAYSISNKLSKPSKLEPKLSIPLTHTQQLQ